VKPWQFTSESYPRIERAEAWREAMGRLGLPVGGMTDTAPPSASVVCLTSPLGIEFALVEAGAQTISGRRTDLPSAVWLAVLLYGEAVLVTDELAEDMAQGDIAYGVSGRMATLELRTRCRLMFIRAPRVAIDHRVITSGSLRIGLLRTQDGVAHIFSGLLRATADALDTLTADQLRPVELALTEFMAASLAQPATDAAAPAASSGRMAHLQRILQTIESLLPDPELSLRRVAREEGVSPRYIQKLFTGAGDSFSHYLRLRRLERCRIDLGSPQCAGLSISEICFRWGFNGSAYFSRAFRAQYGVAPREHRLAASAAAK
jgi:AraC-like DNA-binding protein